METKLYPNPGASRLIDSEAITHTPEDIRKHLDLSLKALNTDKIEMFYLRAYYARWFGEARMTDNLSMVSDGPDRKTPYEETLRAVNEEYKEGKFKRFGISVSLFMQYCFLPRFGLWL